MKTSIQDIVAMVSVLIACMAIVFSIAGAFRAGVLKRIRFGKIEIEAPSEEAKRLREIIVTSAKGEKDIPFEVEQLTNYYSQILAQSKVSFWFSLIFASLGFLIIVVAAFLYKEGSFTATVAQFISGLIMDAVAGLFFVQSKNAQKSMGEFFDKLRSDRMQMESRNLCDAIISKNAQDALRVLLSLHYAGVQNAESVAKNIAETTLKDKD